MGGDTSAPQVALDPGGNVWVAGSSFGALDGTPLSGKASAFLVKFDPGGNKLFTRQEGAGGDTVTDALDLAVDAHGAAYVVGNTGGGLDGNALVGTLDGFVLKYDSDGNRL